jgi:hypothetical protein
VKAIKISLHLADALFLAVVGFFVFKILEKHINPMDIP